MQATDSTFSKLSPKKIREDLNWLASQPAFYQVPSEVADIVELPELSPIALDELPLGLSQFMSNIRSLGAYFESLIAIYIKLSPLFALKARNVQVIVEGKTLGEFDFLVHNHELNQIEHWEVAVKFYLKIGHGWFGPNLKDNLRKKYTHLLNQQLSLSEKPLVKVYLEQQGITVATKKLLTRGFLVRHHEDTDDATPEECFDSAEILTWYQNTELENNKNFTESRFFILNKLSWVGLPLIGGGGMSLEEFLVVFAESDKEVIMVSAMSSGNAEQHQFFVVKGSWLARAQALPY